MGRVYNHFSKSSLRKILRNDLSPIEHRVWQFLRGKQMENIRFRRQSGIGRYVVDFYTPSLHLIIEIDGDTHGGEDAEVNDQKRQLYLESLGNTVLRFTNRDVVERMEGVHEKIVETVKELQKSRSERLPL